MSRGAGAAAERKRGPRESWGSDLESGRGRPLASNSGRIPILRWDPCSAPLAAPLGGDATGANVGAADETALFARDTARRQAA